ncbi:hypothetical protein ABLN64_18330, partial [Mycobacterium tuberculosis]
TSFEFIKYGCLDRTYHTRVSFRIYRETLSRFRAPLQCPSVRPTVPRATSTSTRFRRTHRACG